MAWPGEQQDHRQKWTGVTAPSTTWGLLRAPGGSSANSWSYFCVTSKETLTSLKCTQLRWVVPLGGVASVIRALQILAIIA